MNLFINVFILLVNSLINVLNSFYIKELIERGYDEIVIKDWIDYFEKKMKKKYLIKII